LEPQAASTYCDTAWLLWSRWVSWKRDHEAMPVGEGGDKAAHALLLKGRQANLDSAPYHINAGMTMWGVATYHDATYYDFVLDSFHLAEEHAADMKTLIQARLLVGHAYRKMDKPDEAIAAYRRVLDVDPQHEIATRLIDELENPQAED
jgi:tetratricopeptide (TPR) repeat protein